MTDLTISIINYKTRDLTSSCLKSILNKKIKIDYEIWVVDNASDDGSYAYLKKNFPQVNFIASSKNLGFAGGHNLVLKKVKTGYVLILNSDTQILGDSIDEMVKFMDDHPGVGVSSCKVLGFDGKLQPNAGDLPIGLSLLGWLFNLESIGLKFNFHRNELAYYQTAHEVGWVSGNFMLVRGELFQKIGFFDESYFMYFEDVEFCFRAQKAGFKTIINPEVSIKHLSGGSLDEPHFRQWSGELKGLGLFYKKHFGIWWAYFVKVLAYCCVILRMIVFLILGKGVLAKTYAKVIVSL